MPNIQAAIRKAIQIAGTADILKNKKLLLDMLDDLLPEESKEKRFIFSIFTDEFGKILSMAWYSQKNGQNGSWDEVKKYLDDKLALKESHQKWVTACFKIAFSDGESIETAGLSPNGGGSYKEQPTIDYEATMKEAQSMEKDGNIEKAVLMYEMIKDGADYEKEANKRLAKIFEAAPEKSFVYFRRAAELGDIDACFEAAYMYEYGNGTEKNISEAAKYYMVAAKGGHRGALHNLGIFYYIGKGMKQDYKRAFELLQKAAAMGKPESMHDIGVMYENGDYVERDYEKALNWYKKAEENGYSDAKEDIRRAQNMLRNKYHIYLA